MVASDIAARVNNCVAGWRAFHATLAEFFNPLMGKHKPFAAGTPLKKVIIVHVSVKLNFITGVSKIHYYTSVQIVLYMKINVNGSDHKRILQ